MSFDKEIYIIRHGETEYNKAKIIQGSGVDSSLNDHGKSQAFKFYNAHKNVSFDKIFVSGLLRTYETALPFIEQGIPFEKIEHLNEISWGIYEGNPSTKEMHKAYHKVNSKWESKEYEARIEGGESAAEMSLRLRLAIERIRTETVDRLLVVSHGRAMRCLLCLLNDQEISKMNDFGHKNTGLYKFNLSSGEFNMTLANDASHLI